MNQPYRILQALYDIVRDDPYPPQYHRHMGELLLRLKGEWEHENLEELVRNELVLVKKGPSGIVILLTEKGVAKAKMRFTFSGRG